jgi:hypothetical protein
MKIKSGAPSLQSRVRRRAAGKQASGEACNGDLPVRPRFGVSGESRSSQPVFVQTL